MAFRIQLWSKSHLVWSLSPLTSLVHDVTCPNYQPDGGALSCSFVLQKHLDSFAGFAASILWLVSL
jgi:hypothetical protein